MSSCRQIVIGLAFLCTVSSFHIPHNSLYIRSSFDDNDLTPESHALLARTDALLDPSYLVASARSVASPEHSIYSLLRKRQPGKRKSPSPAPPPRTPSPEPPSSPSRGTKRKHSDESNAPSGSSSNPGNGQNAQTSPERKISPLPAGKSKVFKGPISKDDKVNNPHGLEQAKMQAGGAVGFKDGKSVASLDGRPDRSGADAAQMKGAAQAIGEDGITITGIGSKADRKEAEKRLRKLPNASDAQHAVGDAREAQGKNRLISPGTRMSNAEVGPRYGQGKDNVVDKNGNPTKAFTTGVPRDAGGRSGQAEKSAIDKIGKADPHGNTVNKAVITFQNVPDNRNMNEITDRTKQDIEEGKSAPSSVGERYKATSSDSEGTWSEKERKKKQKNVKRSLILEILRRDLEFELAVRELAREHL